MKTLENIFYHKLKKTPPINVKRALLVENKGLVGDYHFGEMDKQLSLSDLSTIDWIKNSNEDGLCFKRFLPNLIVDEMEQISNNTIIDIGESKLIVTQNKKECHAKQCHLYNKGNKCKLRENVIYLNVLKGGSINIKDKIVKKDNF